MFLKQSTAVVIPFGPFVDETDGITLVTSIVSALDHASTGIKLSKNGGALTIRHATVTATTYDAYGNYLVTLDTTDTNTVGRLRVQFSDPTTNVPVWQDFFVLSASVFNWLTGAVGPLTPTTADRTLDVTATGAAGIDWGNVENPTTTLNLSGTNIKTDQVVASVSGAVGSVTGAVGSVTGNVGGNVTGSVGSVASGGIAAASFAAGAINAAAIADNAIDAGAIAADAITAAKIADGAIDTATFASGCTIPRVTLADTVTTYTGNTPQTGDSFARIGVNGAGLTNVVLPAGGLANVTAWSVAITGNITGNVSGTVAGVTPATNAQVVSAVSGLATAADLATVAGYLDTEIAAILADTNELQTDWTNGGRLDSILDAILVDTAGIEASLTSSLTNAAPFLSAVFGVSVPPQAVGTDFNGTAVDMNASPVMECFATQCVGVMEETGTLAGRMQESANSSDWSDIAGAVFAQVDGSDDLQQITFTRTMRYVRWIGDLTGAGVVFNVNVCVGDVPVVSSLTGMVEDTLPTLATQASVDTVDTVVDSIKTDTGDLVSRITSTLFSGITSLAQWLGLLAGKQSGNSTARTELRATGAGSGTFDETTDSQEAIRDRGDSAWTTATGFSTLSSADVSAAVWNAGVADYGISGSYGAVIENCLNASLQDIPAAVWGVSTRVLTAGTNIVLAKGAGVTGFNDLSAADAAGAVWNAATASYGSAGSYGLLVETNLDAAVSTRSTYAGADTSGTTTLLSRLSSSRAGYLDNLNIGGAAASQADISALNQSASRRVVLATVGQYERPDSGNTTYQLELRTYDGDGAATNADTTPSLTATGIVSGDLSANLSSATNPSTGVYRWTYTVASSATIEQIRFDASAAISSSTFTIAAYAQTVDSVSVTWTSADAAKLTAVYNKLPTNNIADQTILATSITSLQTSVDGVQSDTDNIQTRLPASLIGGRLDATVGAMQSGVLTAAAIAASALNGKGDWLLSSSYSAPPSAASISSVVWAETTRVLTAGTNIVLAKGTGVTGFNDIAAADVWGVGTRTLTAFSFTVSLTSAYDPAKTAAQAGDAMTLTVGAGSSLATATAAAITSDHGSGSYVRNTEPPTASQNAIAVVDQTLSGHTTVGTVGGALNASGSSGDPWSTVLPGSYSEGTAGHTVGNMLDATVTSRLADSDYTAPSNPTDYARNDVSPSWYSSGGGGLTAEEVWAYPDRTLAASALDAILVATGLESGRFVDSNGAPVSALNLRQAIALLLAYSAGDRSGIGTREIIAALAGDSTQVKASRVSQSVIQSTGIVPV